MSKITLNNVANLQDTTTAQTTINVNNATIQTAFDNTLSRDGTTPNQMGATLDMNSNHVINLPAAAGPTEPVRLGDLVTGSFVLPSLIGDVTASAAMGPLTTTVAKIQGTTVTGTTGTGKVVLQTNPTISTIVNTGTLTLPTSTDTLVGRATTDTLTNKTMVLSGGSNTVSIGANTLNSITGSGAVVFQVSPTLTTPTLGAATATTINGVTIPSTTATALTTGGQCLTLGPSNPTGTASASSVMMGVGSLCKITPTFSTRVMVIFNFLGANTVATDGGGLAIRFGTGTAPVNGAAATGSVVVGGLQYTSNLAGQQVPVSAAGLVTGLTTGTQYWFDVGLNTLVGGTAALVNFNVFLMEV